MAQSRETRNALRRVQRFLDDPERYDKFRLLTKVQQSRVLDKVEAGNSRAASQDVEQLTINRKARARVTRIRNKKVADYITSGHRGGEHRPTDWDAQDWRRYQLMMGY
jgi:hypothetical protein